MGELTLFEGGKLPSFLKNAEVDETTLALTGSAQRGSRRISIKGGVFREMIGGKEYRVSEERAMNIIIIKAAPKVSRTYYEGSYSEGEAVRPTCWSSDSEKPDADVKNKQSKTCMACPHHVKGSAANDGRACRFSQRLAVAIDGELEKEEIYQLVLPSTSIFGDGVKNKWPLRAYATYLKEEGAPVPGVITEMRFDTSSPTPKLVFRPIRVVKEHEWEIIQRLKDSEDAEKACAMQVFQTDEVEDEPKAKPAKVKPKVVIEEDEEEDIKPTKKATPVVEEDEDEEEDIKPVKKAKPVVEADEEEAVEEPKKATTKKAAASDELSIDDLIGEWDD